MNEKHHLERKLNEIHQVIKNKYSSVSEIGVLGGLSGIALFEFYYSKFLDTEEPSDIGVSIISECISKINEGYGMHTFCNGIAGFGWVVDHLNNHGFIEVDIDSLLSPLDPFLFTAMCSDIKEKNFDFLHGAIGTGFYFFKRYQHSKDVIYKEYILYLLNSLLKFSENENGKYKWESILDIENGTKGYNLSLSHGISSVINFLSRLYLFEEFKPLAKPMLLGAIKYLTSFKSEKKENLSLFPSWITNCEPITYQSRISWCYGDLGIGLTLYRASKVIKDNELMKSSIQILTHAAKRKTVEETRIIDAGFCHGSYGNAQIFHKIHKETELSIFKESTHFWIQDGLGKAIHKDGYAGYKQWGGKDQTWKPELTILEGIAGIGLTIIDYLVDGEEKWDECLLLS